LLTPGNYWEGREIIVGQHHDRVLGQSPPSANIRSGLIATSSPARLRSRSGLPSAYRYSITIFCDSVYPKSRRPRRNTPRLGSVSGVPNSRQRRPSPRRMPRARGSHGRQATTWCRHPCRLHCRHHLVTRDVIGPVRHTVPGSLRGVRLKQRQFSRPAAWGVVIAEALVKSDLLTRPSEETRSPRCREHCRGCQLCRKNRCGPRPAC
jgi:hypothetical protein